MVLGKCAYIQVWVFEPVGALFGLGCWSSSLRWRNQHFAPALHPLLRKTQNGGYHLSQVLSFSQPPFLVTVTRRSIVSSSGLVLVLCNGRLLVLEKAVDGLVESVLPIGFFFPLPLFWSSCFGCPLPAISFLSVTFLGRDDWDCSVFHATCLFSCDV